MSLTKKNRQILQHIVRYCQEIEVTARHFTTNPLKEEEQFIALNAICMPIQQIGELCNHLDRDFRENHGEMPWREIIGMRNIFAHDYENTNADKVMETVQYDIPRLLQYCQDLLSGEDG